MNKLYHIETKMQFYFTIINKNVIITQKRQIKIPAFNIKYIFYYLFIPLSEARFE